MVIFKKIIRLTKNIIKNNFLPKSKLTKDIVYLLKKNHTASPVIFDVGAYKGNWIKIYLKSFPKLRGFLFEPYRISYEYLIKRFKNKNRLSIFNIALSSDIGTLDVNVNTKAYTNSLLELDPLASDSWKNDELQHKEKMKVLVSTLDSFYENISKNINRINLLKLDVQGLEHEVLKGGHNLLDKKLVDIILIEMLVAPTYKKQSQLSKLFEIFENYDYVLYGIYDIERGSKFGPIQQFDAIFTKSNFV